MVSSLFGISTYCKSELPKRDNYAIFVDLWFSGLKKVARKNKSKILDLTPPSPCTFRTRTCKRVVTQKKENIWLGNSNCQLWAQGLHSDPSPPWGRPYHNGTAGILFICVRQICTDKDIYFYSQLKGKIAWRIACADLAIQVYEHIYNKYTRDFFVMFFFPVSYVFWQMEEICEKKSYSCDGSNSESRNT